MNTTWSVYILKCKNSNYYIGCIQNLFARLEKHKVGLVKYTSNKRPIELVTYICFNNKYKAFEMEKYLKSGSGRAFMKRHLI
jgi:predicted GIY-YIG superfamily endonuclease